MMKLDEFPPCTDWVTMKQKLKKRGLRTRDKKRNRIKHERDSKKAFDKRPISKQVE
jgi:hypothetical protein